MMLIFLTTVTALVFASLSLAAQKEEFSNFQEKSLLYVLKDLYIHGMGILPYSCASAEHPEVCWPRALYDI